MAVGDNPGRGLLHCLDTLSSQVFSCDNRNGCYARNFLQQACAAHSALDIARVNPGGYFNREIHLTVIGETPAANHSVKTRNFLHVRFSKRPVGACGAQQVIEFGIGEESGLADDASEVSKGPFAVFPFEGIAFESSHVSLQNGYISLQNGYISLQNGYISLQNGYISLQDLDILLDAIEALVHLFNNPGQVAEQAGQ